MNIGLIKIEALCYTQLKKDNIQVLRNAIGCKIKRTPFLYKESEGYSTNCIALSPSCLSETIVVQAIEVATQLSSNNNILNECTFIRIKEKVAFKSKHKKHAIVLLPLKYEGEFFRKTSSPLSVLTSLISLSKLKGMWGNGITSQKCLSTLSSLTSETSSMWYTKKQTHEDEKIEINSRVNSSLSSNNSDVSVRSRKSKRSYDSNRTIDNSTVQLQTSFISNENYQCKHKGACNCLHFYDTPFTESEGEAPQIPLTTRKSNSYYESNQSSTKANSLKIKEKPIISQKPNKDKSAVILATQNEIKLAKSRLKKTKSQEEISIYDLGISVDENKQETLNRSKSIACITQEFDEDEYDDDLNRQIIRNKLYSPHMVLASILKSKGMQKEERQNVRFHSSKLIETAL